MLSVNIWVQTNATDFLFTTTEAACASVALSQLPKVKSIGKHLIAFVIIIPDLPYHLLK